MIRFCDLDLIFKVTRVMQLKRLGWREGGGIFILTTPSSLLLQIQIFSEFQNS